MTPRELLAELTRRGITVEPGSGGKLRCSPRSSIDAVTAEKLRRHKQEILALLSASSPCSSAGELPRFIQRELEEASELGLVARWSRKFGYVSVHDPTTGNGTTSSSRGPLIGREKKRSSARTSANTTIFSGY